MAGVPIQRANLKLWPEKGLSHTDQTAVSSWTQQIRWEAGWCATYLPRGAILIETFNKVLSKDSGSHRFYFWPIICFNTSRMRVYFMFEVVSSVVVKEGKVRGWFWDQTLGVLLSFMEEYEVKKILGALFLKIGFSDETSIPWKWWTQCLFWLAHRIVSQEWQNYTQAMIPICTRTPPSCSTCGQSLSNNSNSFGTNSECWFCHSFLTLTTPYEQLSKDDQVFRK